MGTTYTTTYKTTTTTTTTIKTTYSTTTTTTTTTTTPLWYNPYRVRRPSPTAHADPAPLPKELKAYTPKLKLTTIKYHEHTTLPYIKPSFESIPYLEKLPAYHPKQYTADATTNIPFRAVPTQEEEQHVPYYHRF